MKWTFSLPFPTPSLNEIQGWHWSHAKRSKAYIAQYLGIVLLGYPKIPAATGKRRLTIVRHGKGRLDKANLIGGAKWVEDAIKDRGLLIDDRDEFCEMIVEQVVSRSVKPFTHIILEDIGEAS
jgi:hypothetical protein